MPDNEWIHDAHKFIAKQLHKPAGALGYYTQGRVNKDSYALSLEAEVDEVEHMLDDKGFYRNPTAFLTYRKLDYGDGKQKNYTEGSWVNYLNGLLGEDQLHITLYSDQDDEYVDIYAHHETNWFRHPYKHLADNDYSAEKGVEMIEEMFGDKPLKVYRSSSERGWK